MGEINVIPDTIEIKDDGFNIYDELKPVYDKMIARGHSISEIVAFTKVGFEQLHKIFNA